MGEQDRNATRPLGRNAPAQRCEHGLVAARPGETPLKELGLPLRLRQTPAGPPKPTLLRRKGHWERKWLHAGWSSAVVLDPVGALEQNGLRANPAAKVRLRSLSRSDGSGSPVGDARTFIRGDWFGAGTERPSRGLWSAWASATTTRQTCATSRISASSPARSRRHPVRGGTRKRSGRGNRRRPRPLQALGVDELVTSRGFRARQGRSSPNCECRQCRVGCLLLSTGPRPSEENSDQLRRRKVQIANPNACSASRACLRHNANLSRRCRTSHRFASQAAKRARLLHNSVGRT